VRASAAATVREEERLKRAKPMTLEQEELRAMLACVPPFDLIQASSRNAKLAAAAAAATAAADAATAAAAFGGSGGGVTAAGTDCGARPHPPREGVASLGEGGRSMVGGASLEASLLALRSCQETVLRSLQLDSIAPGLRVDITSRLKSVYSTYLKMRRKDVSFGQVCDARALRVVIGEPGQAPGTKDEVEACFVLLVRRLQGFRVEG